MKNIKKDIQSLVGLVATASLAIVSNGLLNSTLNIGVGLTANFLTGLTPAKIKRWKVFQRMLLEEIRDDIKNIKDELSLKPEKSAFSGEQIDSTIDNSNFSASSLISNLKK